MRNDTKTVDGQWRTGMEINDSRLQPKTTRSALTVGDFEELPKFMSSPVIDVPLPAVNYSAHPSVNATPVPHNDLLNGDQLRGMFGKRKESPSEQFEAGYNAPPPKASYLTTTNSVRDQSPDYAELDGVDPQQGLRAKRGG